MVSHGDRMLALFVLQLAALTYDQRAQCRLPYASAMRASSAAFGILRERAPALSCLRSCAPQLARTAPPPERSGSASAPLDFATLTASFLTLTRLPLLGVTLFCTL
jgi:hypothetical protein